jgi:hypothetical protein
VWTEVGPVPLLVGLDLVPPSQLLGPNILGLLLTSGVRKIFLMAPDAGRRQTSWEFQTLCKPNYIRADISDQSFHESVSGMLAELDLSWMHVPLVAHRGAAYGLVMKHKSGWQIV